MKKRLAKHQGSGEDEVSEIIRKILDDIAAEYRQEQKLKRSMKREARLSESKKVYLKG
jgi:plasmid stability protein